MDHTTIISRKVCVPTRISAYRERHEIGGGHSEHGLNKITPLKSYLTKIVRRYSLYGVASTVHAVVVSTLNLNIRAIF